MKKAKQSQWYKENVASGTFSQRQSAVLSAPATPTAEKTMALEPTIPLIIVTSFIAGVGSTLLASSFIAKRKADRQYRDHLAMVSAAKDRKPTHKLDSEGFKIPNPGEDPDGNWVGSFKVGGVRRDIDAIQAKKLADEDEERSMYHALSKIGLYGTNYSNAEDSERSRDTDPGYEMPGAYMDRHASAVATARDRLRNTRPGYRNP